MKKTKNALTSFFCSDIPMSTSITLPPAGETGWHLMLSSTNTGSTLHHLHYHLLATPLLTVSYDLEKTQTDMKIFAANFWSIIVPHESSEQRFPFTLVTVKWKSAVVQVRCCWCRQIIELSIWSVSLQTRPDRLWQAEEIKCSLQPAECLQPGWAASGPHQAAGPRGWAAHTCV